MKLYRYTSYALVLLLIIPLILPAVSVTASTEGYDNVLKKMGIEVPKDRLAGEVRTYTLTVGKIEFQPAIDGYVNVVAETSSPSHLQYVASPGKPMIPYISYYFVVDGYVDKAVVSVKPLSVREVRVNSKILPAPQPLAFSPDFPNKIVYEPDKEVYGKDSFFPGTLATVKVYHGLLGKSIIVIHVYPIQYNPVEDKLIVIDNLKVSIYYPQPKPMQFPQKSLVIITTPDLVDLVNNTLAEFYKSKGFNVTIVDTDYIYENYSPVRNITEYSGFYNVTYHDNIYELLKRSYNHTLARKIIRFLNETYGNFTHVLLIGNAVDVPPSFYFQYSSYLYYYLDPYNAWIPTDLFYADLDRDLIPDLFVGRIPFSNITYVNYTIHKIMAWYNTSAASSDLLFMAGGYPFGYAEMFGETALSTMTLFNDTQTFNTNLLTRTSYNYNSESVKAILQGNLSALWFFLIAHGSGDAFVDQLATPYGLYWEMLASTGDLLTMRPNPSVPIVSSVACMNGAWDTKLVPPTGWFMPPSIGESILLSPAGGVAYLGSARIAWELLGPFIYYYGVEYNYFYGTTLIHREIISAYNTHRFMGDEVTLGQVVAEGIIGYLAGTGWIMDFGPEYADIIMSVVMMLSLLGDPALELPVPTAVVEKPWLGLAYGYNAVDYVDADLVFPGDYGYIPFFKPAEPAIIALMGGGTTPVIVYENRIYSWYYYLDYHRLVGFNVTGIQDGYGVYTTVFDEMKSGKVLIKFVVPGWGELRYQTLAAGVVVKPDRVVIGGLINIEGYGLDAFGTIDTVDIVVAGRTLASAPVDTTTGYFNWSLALPYMAPGVYKVSVVAPGLPPSIVDLLSGYVAVYSDEALDIIVSAPVVAEVGEVVPVAIATLYKGQPVDAVLLVKVTDPEGVEKSIVAVPVTTGVYTVELNVTETGLYRLEVVASYITPTTESYGYKSVSITAVDKLYTIGASFDQTMELIRLVNATLSSGITDIINRITVLDNRTVIIDTKLGEIKGMLVEINDNVLAVNTTAGLILVKLDELENELKSDISNAKQEVLSEIDEKAQELKDVITSSTQELKTKINETSQDVLTVGKKVDQLTTIVEAMTAIAYILIIGAGIAAARRG
ncbi:hypothetical protein J4526_06500 [Desulfurococcaceae archaeon MEX13E-LK6-19]|nr:hypothetical protein J4526_06500 [Desulfurococcaceae archaeon MEX13E-LK6-19]